MTGEEAQAALGEKLTAACSDFHTLQEKVAKLKDLTRKCSRSSDLADGSTITATDFVRTMEIPPEDRWLNDDVMPKMIKNILDQCPDEKVQPSEEEIWTRPLPAELVIEETFFRLKGETDAFKKAQEKYESLKVKHNKLMEKTTSQMHKKRKTAEKGIAEETAGPELHQQKLARRNQINRTRRGVKTIKKVRNEEGLGEAGSCSNMSHVMYVQKPRMLYLPQRQF